MREEAVQLHKQALVIDSLSFPYILEKEFYPAVQQGGVDAAVITAAISEDFKGAVRQISGIRKQLDRMKGHAVLACSADDVRRAKGEGRTALILGFQDIEPIEDDVSFLEVFYDLGVRVVQVTYTGGNRAGDGCGERTNSGLRYFGLEVIEEMNRLGMMVDLSHTGDASTEEALKISSSPGVFTHANCRALCDNMRNKTDEQIRMSAERGGYIGLTPHPALVTRKKSPDISDFLDQIDHAVKIGGIGAVGIGLDYIEGLKTDTAVPASVRTWRTRRPDMFGTVDDFFTASFTEGLESIDKLPNLTDGLMGRGYTPSHIEKILGENFLRVFQEITGS